MVRACNRRSPLTPRRFFFARPHVEHMHTTTRALARLAGRLFIRTLFRESQKEPQPFTAVTLLNFALRVFCRANSCLPSPPSLTLSPFLSRSCVRADLFQPPSVLGEPLSVFIYFSLSCSWRYFFFRSRR